ncbi:hypothetical protein BD769DRAFT_1674378 [Suillus cothurnatus]|nr:hypothetical protein BD769DRAFT_1674378 [Suillus cothurnatus]
MKQAKIDFLRLAPAEWTHVGKFTDLLSYADVAQQAFLSELSTTLHLAIPALETLHRTWSSCARRPKYAHFAPALLSAAQKLDKYYEKTTGSPSYVMTMLLDPTGKMLYFKKNWPENLQDDVLNCAERVFKACYHELGQAASMSQPSLAKKGKASGLKMFIRETQSSEEDDNDKTVVTHTDPSRSWYASFKNYIDAIETKPPPEMSAIQCKHAFSQGGITISKHRNHLKGDIIEAFQCIKCALCHDVLFCEPGPSSSTEEALEDLDTKSDTSNSKKLSDAEDEGWDALLEGDEDLIESDSDFM